MLLEVGASMARMRSSTALSRNAPRGARAHSGSRRFQTSAWSVSFVIDGLSADPRTPYAELGVEQHEVGVTAGGDASLAVVEAENAGGVGAGETRGGGQVEPEPARRVAHRDIEREPAAGQAAGGGVGRRERAGPPAAAKQTSRPPKR